MCNRTTFNDEQNHTIFQIIKAHEMTKVKQLKRETNA